LENALKRPGRRALPSSFREEGVGVLAGDFSLKIQSEQVYALSGPLRPQFYPSLARWNTGRSFPAQAGAED